MDTVDLSTIPENDLPQVIRILEITIGHFKLVQWLQTEDITDAWNFASKCLLMVIEELKTRGTFNLLKDLVNTENQIYEENQTMKEALVSSKSNRKQLKSRYKEQVETFEKEITRKNKFIEEQCAELERLKEQNRKGLEFNKELLKVQVEENELKCELEEKQLKEQAVQVEVAMKEEEEVHSEVKFYYENEIQRLNGLISHWKERFRDIEERKVELQRLKENHVVQHEELEFYKNLFQSRKSEIDDYLADKERRRQERERELHAHQMATRIQSWWRGVMVRRCLGPFKHLLKLKNAKKRKMSIKKITKK